MLEHSDGTVLSAAEVYPASADPLPSDSLYAPTSQLHTRTAAALSGCRRVEVTTLPGGPSYRSSILKITDDSGHKIQMYESDVVVFPLSPSKTCLRNLTHGKRCYNRGESEGGFAVLDGGLRLRQWLEVPGDVINYEYEWDGNHFKSAEP